MDIARIYNMAAENDITNDIFTIIAVGRVCEAKNYKLLIDAIKRLNDKGYVFQCQIIGDGDLMSDIIQYKECNHLDNLYLLGAKNNPYPYIKAADLYVCSSVYEGLSTTTIEAIILGKPCVVTDCAGMRTILGKNNEYGVVVPIEVESLTNEIGKMISDGQYRHKYENRAKERASAFTTEKTYDDIERLLVGDNNQ